MVKQREGSSVRDCTQTFMHRISESMEERGSQRSNIEGNSHIQVEPAQKDVNCMTCRVT